MLRRSGLTTDMILPISAGLLTDIDRYFAALNDYQHGVIEPIVSAFTTAALATAANARQLADELTEIREGWKERVTARSDSAVWLVLGEALKSPAISATSIAGELDMTPHRARAAIEQLEDAGILHTNSKARRNKVWLATRCGSSPTSSMPSKHSWTAPAANAPVNDRADPRPAIIPVRADHRPVERIRCPRRRPVRGRSCLGP